MMQSALLRTSIVLLDSVLLAVTVAPIVWLAFNSASPIWYFVLVPVAWLALWSGIILLRRYLKRCHHQLRRARAGVKNPLHALHSATRVSQCRFC